MNEWIRRLRAREPRAVLIALGAVVVAVAAVLLAGALAAAPRGGSQQAAASPTPAVESPPAQATPPAEGTPFKLLTPGPTVPAGHWRWRGTVIDSDGKPIADACVHIGPGECRFNSVRTDEQGAWVIDFPQVDVIYEFHFVKDGYQRVDDQIRTKGPGELNIRMVRS